MRIARVIMTGTLDDFRQLIREEFGVELGEHEAAVFHWHARKNGPGFLPLDYGDFRHRLTDAFGNGTWRIWLNCQLIKAGVYRCGGLYGKRPGRRYTVRLSVGFAQLEETPEQLERLRRVDADGDDFDDGAVGAPRPRRQRPPRGLQTPGIERTEVVLRPIDRVASRCLIGYSGQGA